MNHTIKGILIVAAITSMLVVGATMVPIMQNSFASKSEVKKTHEVKKSHEVKKVQRDTDKNINVNRNSATSSSSSSATASNTNNINNTATSAQSQEQNACAVAVTCPGGTTTVTPPTVIPSGPCAGFVFDVHLREASGDFPKGTEICLIKPGENSPNNTPAGATIIPPGGTPLTGQTVRIDHAVGGNCPGGTHVDVDTGNPPDGFSLGEIACVTIAPT
jgi:hypothetical protein